MPKRTPPDSRAADPDAPCPGDERGFTLLELVLCIAILGTSFLSLLFLKASAIEKAQRFNLERKCQRLAQEKLDEIVYGIEAETAGDFEEEPTWTWEVEIFSLANSDTLYPLLQASITVVYIVDENLDPEEYILDTRFFADVEHPLHEYATNEEETGL